MVVKSNVNAVVVCGGFFLQIWYVLNSFGVISMLRIVKGHLIPALAATHRFIESTHQWMVDHPRLEYITLAPWTTGAAKIGEKH